MSTATLEAPATAAMETFEVEHRGKRAWVSVDANRFDSEYLASLKKFRILSLRDLATFLGTAAIMNRSAFGAAETEEPGVSIDFQAPNGGEGGIAPGDADL